MERIDIRLAKGRAWEDLDGTPSEDGRSALWAKAAGLEISAATLAILGDYVPFGIAQALGYWTRSNSLDNTLRIAQIVPTEWVLLDIAVNTVRNGFGHGRVHLWAADGTLLATASQSAVVHQLKDS
jgi:acyl-CoA thioesterase